MRMDMCVPSDHVQRKLDLGTSSCYVDKGDAIASRFEAIVSGNLQKSKSNPNHTWALSLSVFRLFRPRYPYLSVSLCS